jgi:stage V sporulation protein B
MVLGGYWFATRYGSGVDGAAWGVVAAAVLTLGIALAIVGTGKAGRGGPSVRQHLLFIGPLFFGQVVFNLLLQADSLLLRRFSGEAAQAAGLTITAADPLVGAYRATQLFSFLPYQLLIAVTFVLFPMLATAYRDADRGAVARYVRTGVRLALILAGLMVSVTSGLAGPLLRLVFGQQAAELGARAMQVLTLGFGAFALFGVLTTVLNSLKEERKSALITLAAFSLVAVLGIAYVRGTPFGEELLWRMAVSTSAGLLLATLLAAYAVKRVAGAVLSPLSLGRVLIAMTLAIGVAHLLPAPGKIVTLVYAAVVASVYVATLVVLKELGREDVATVRAVVRRRRP